MAFNRRHQKPCRLSCWCHRFRPAGPVAFSYGLRDRRFAIQGM